MPILSFQVTPIGESAQLPKIIYLNTTDTTESVLTEGYLNKLFYDQRVPLSKKDMALVTTLNSNVANLYSVILVGRNWSLIPYPSNDVIGAINLGSGVGLFKDVEGSNLAFYSLLAGTNTSVNLVGNSVVISATGAESLVWNHVVASTQQISPNNGYFVDNPAGVTFTLPMVISSGDIFKIVGRYGVGWTLLQNSGQVVHTGDEPTSNGLSGSITSLQEFTCIDVICSISNFEFVVTSSFGNYLVT